jgi:hypothetical protein
MKHSAECVLIPLRELVALGQALALPIPQSLTDRVSNMPAIPAAKTATTILSNVGAPLGATTIAFVTPVAVQPGDVITIDTELMLVTAVLDPQTPTGSQQSVQVVRAYGGSTAASHSSGATVSFVTMTAAQLATDLIHNALLRRADLSTAYVWPYQATPPSWVTKPNQVGGPAGAIAMTTEQTGVIIPAAPGGGTPNPAPPASGPALVGGKP